MLLNIEITLSKSLCFNSFTFAVNSPVLYISKKNIFFSTILFNNIFKIFFYLLYLSGNFEFIIIFKTLRIDWTINTNK